jgi:four helix bundle protein
VINSRKRRKVMAAFRRFEDILAWQKARETTRLVYQETTKGDFSRDYDLRSQIRRAAISVMANIAEGFGRHSDKEFANFLNIAHGSATEVQSHLYIILLSTLAILNKTVSIGSMP